jgi:hypothetical protein
MEQKKPMTRQQRRFIERVESEAHDINVKLKQKFIDYLVIADNPTEDEMLDKANVLSAQWKMYCKSRHIDNKALPLVHDYCMRAIEEYNHLKDAERVTTNAQV